MTNCDTELGPRITVATMQTAASELFRRHIANGAHLFLVADEVHQLGSNRLADFMEVDTGSRLGLSATPRRYGDPEGTERLLSYFHGVVPPPFTIYDAIKAGRLVPYEYLPHTVSLSAEEARAWKKFTVELRREFARSTGREGGSNTLSDRAKMLMINRARIAKRAEAKVPLASSVIAEHFEDSQRWLVYCEDLDQLQAVRSALRASGIQPSEYHSEMSGDPATVLEWFKAFGGVMLSVRCLDEGIDIPSASHALILASSQNPRQFIQRRGRILRKAPNKELGVIHDAIVVPTDSEEELDQASLLRSELQRALEFSRYAVNATAGSRLRAIAIELGIDPDALSDAGVEEDGDEV